MALLTLRRNMWGEQPREMVRRTIGLIWDIFEMSVEYLGEFKMRS